MKHPIRAGFAALLMAGLMIVQSDRADAAVVEFEDAPSGFFLTNTYEEDGFSFAVAAGHYDLFTGSPVGGNQFNIDEFNFGLSEIVITFAGGLFDFDSFFITDDAVAGGYSITSNLGETVDAGSLGSGLVSFASMFNGITSLTITQNSNGFFAFDNFTATPGRGGPTPSAVPLPASLPLLLAGMAGLGVLSRRRKRAA